MAKAKPELGPVDRVAAILTNGLDDQLPNDPEFEAKYPHLWAWLTVRVLATGEVKERAQLTIQVDAGDWEVSLRDASLACSYSGLGHTVQSGLEALEAVLRDPERIPRRWHGRKPKLTKPSKD